MASKRHFDDLHLDTHQVSMSVSGAPIYSDTSAYSTPGWTTSYQYPSMMTSGPDGLTYDNTWSYSSTSDNDPSLFSSSSEPTNWSNYDTNAWTPSVNPSSASVYSHPLSSTGGFSTTTNTSPWNPSDQKSLSAYSETTSYQDRPPISRSVSADNTNNYLPYSTSSYSPSTARMSSTAPASPGEYLTTTSDAGVSTTSMSRPKSRSSITKPSSKKPTTKPSSDKGSSSKRKNTGGSKSNLTSITLTTTERDYEAQLLARFGHLMPPLTTTMSPSEQIRREAWRICKSEAMEMSQRRMKLLEHEHGALERETQKLQANIGQLRDAITQETRQLEVALAKAERLSSAY